MVDNYPWWIIYSCWMLNLKITQNEQTWWILILPLHATSCHFKSRMPPQVACHFDWRMPLRVAYATSSGVPLRVACHFEWRMQLEWRATSSGVLTA